MSYHKIFIPFHDVYELGGKGVFQHLERKEDESGHAEGKNLIVVPQSFVDKLHDLKENQSGGAEDVLHFLDTVQTTKPKVHCDEKDITVYGAFSGVDIAFVDHREDAGDFSITKLEERIRRVWGGQIETPPALLTQVAKYRIKFRNRGMAIENPNFLLVNAGIVNEGIILGGEALQAMIYEQQGIIPLSAGEDALEQKLHMNQFIQLPNGGDHAVYARVTGKLKMNNDRTRVIGVEDESIELLGREEQARQLRVGSHRMDNLFGVTPRDMEQYLAMQYGLLNPNVSLFFLCGSQGSGKTLLSYVAAMDAVLGYPDAVRRKRGQEGKGGWFKKIVLLKPTDIIGGKQREVGFLPGDLYEKMRPHLMPYIDAHKESQLGSGPHAFPFEQLLRHPKYPTDFGPIRAKISSGVEGAHWPAYNEIFELTYSGFLRGRSFRDTIVLVDEAQNYTPYELKTIIERLGEGCKAVIMGDPRQVDNPNCSREVNGLTYLIKHYLNKPYSALVNLSRNYRSQMSEDAKDLRVFSS